MVVNSEVNVYGEVQSHSTSGVSTGGVKGPGIVTVMSTFPY